MRLAQQFFNLFAQLFDQLALLADELQKLFPRCLVQTGW